MPTWVWCSPNWARAGCARAWRPCSIGAWWPGTRSTASCAGGRCTWTKRAIASCPPCAPRSTRCPAAWRRSWPAGPTRRASRCSCATSTIWCAARRSRRRACGALSTVWPITCSPRRESRASAWPTPGRSSGRQPTSTATSPASLAWGRTWRPRGSSSAPTSTWCWPAASGGCSRWRRTSTGARSTSRARSTFPTCSSARCGCCRRWRSSRAAATGWSRATSTSWWTSSRTPAARSGGWCASSCAPGPRARAWPTAPFPPASSSWATASSRSTAFATPRSPCLTRPHATSRRSAPRRRPARPSRAASDRSASCWRLSTTPAPPSTSSPIGPTPSGMATTTGFP